MRLNAHLSPKRAHPRATHPATENWAHNRHTVPPVPITVGPDKYSALFVVFSRKMPDRSPRVSFSWLSVALGPFPRSQSWCVSDWCDVTTWGNPLRASYGCVEHTAHAAGKVVGPQSAGQHNRRNDL